MTDRKLDALVAEKVMSLPVIHMIEGDSAMMGGCRIDHAYGDVLDTGETSRWGPIVKIIASYSTDIAAFWTVVAQMRVLGFETEIITGSLAESDGKIPVNRPSAQITIWQCERHVGQDFSEWCEFDEISHVFCRLALRALDVEVSA